MDQLVAGAADQLGRLVAEAAAGRRDVEYPVLGVDAHDDVGRIVGQHLKVVRPGGQGGLKFAAPLDGGGDRKAGRRAGQQEDLQHQGVGPDLAWCQGARALAQDRERHGEKARDQQPQRGACDLGRERDQDQHREHQEPQLQVRLQKGEAGHAGQQAEQAQGLQKSIARQQLLQRRPVQGQQDRGHDHQAEGVGQNPDHQGHHRIMWPRRHRQQRSRRQPVQGRGQEGRRGEPHQMPGPAQVEIWPGPGPEQHRAGEDLEAVAQRQAPRDAKAVACAQAGGEAADHASGQERRPALRTATDQSSEDDPVGGPYRSSAAGARGHLDRQPAERKGGHTGGERLHDLAKVESTRRELVLRLVDQRSRQHALFLM